MAVPGNVVDLTPYESDEDAAATMALEGTGALVLDRVNKVARGARQRFFV